MKERERETVSVCVWKRERERLRVQSALDYIFLSTAILHVISVMPEIIDNNNENFNTDGYNNTV